MNLIKKIVLSAIVILLMAGVQPSHAQFFYGATAGYLNSTGYGNDVFGGMNYMGGISAGLTMGFKIVTDFNVQWDLVYSTKGFNQKFIIKDLINAYENDTIQILRTVTKQHTNQLKLTYVEMPLYLKKSFSFKGGVFPYDRTISKWDFDILVGPYVGYLLGSTASLKATRQVTKESAYGVTTGEVTDTASTFMIGQKVSAVLMSSSDTASQATLLALLPKDSPSLSGGLNSIDVGFTVGAGFSLEVNETSKIFINARYSMGLMTIDKTYFNNVTYQFIPDNAGPYLINGNNYSTVESRTKIDLKNKGFGIYFGFIHYLGMNI